MGGDRADGVVVYATFRQQFVLPLLYFGAVPDVGRGVAPGVASLAGMVVM